MKRKSNVTASRPLTRSQKGKKKVLDANIALSLARLAGQDTNLKNSNEMWYLEY
jgi:hypothetical protein